MSDLTPLRSLAHAMGVATEYVDGLKRPVVVPPETLVQVCAALGAPVTGPHDAHQALRAWQHASQGALIPQVLVAWDGLLPPVAVHAGGDLTAALLLEDGQRHYRETLAFEGPGLERGPVCAPVRSTQAVRNARRAARCRGEP